MFAFPFLPALKHDSKPPPPGRTFCTAKRPERHIRSSVVHLMRVQLGDLRKGASRGGGQTDWQCARAPK